MISSDWRYSVANVYHVPVLLNETVNYVLSNVVKTTAKLYIDCTLGGGGYACKILENTNENIKLLAIDRDENSIRYSKEILKKYSERVFYCKDNFANIKDILLSLNFFKVSGVVMDLGLSTYQLNYEDGFSYLRDSELDMRMDMNLKIKAKDVLNKYSEKKLTELFKNYGEIRNSKKLARDIVSQRKKKLFQTSFDLVDLVKENISARFLNKNLSRIFQAVRIHINNEMENLKVFLNDVINFVETSGRIVVVSYHSLEDRIVKNLFRSSVALKVITKKPLKPSKEEIILNRRSRSAKLRVAEKI